MFKKLMIVLSLTVVFSLLVGGLAYAMGEAQWEVAFDPIDYGYQPIDYETFTGGAQIETLEVFKGDLYMCIISGDGGQMYRSPDGENWQAVGALGLGYNSFGCWDMTVFKDELYVSMFNYGPGYIPIPDLILRSADGETFEPVSNSWEGSPILNPGKFGEFKGMLYVLASDENGLSKVWRSKTGNPGTWELAGDIGDNYWISGLVTYKGMLYIAVESFSSGWMNILRSQDGSNWETVMDDSFRSVLQDGTENYWGNFAVHQGKLFFSTANWLQDTLDPNIWIPLGGQILVTGNGTDWEQVVTGGFDDPNNIAIPGLTTYLGDLYAWTANGLTGCEVWKSRTGKAGTWVQVNEDGFGWDNPLRNGESIGDTAQAVFKDELYIAGFDYRWDVRLGMLWKLVHP